ncbi:MAG: Uma2 family endonuclease [Candidatus Tectomicrobia bacterium]|uniref:Uma2 family endonuclease n=1 Tax=Tectimicrobiota bacterium TaxID=2528274 RepID=A0A937VZ98_UNCTE|nr:Uma2 family endonuclease [Candidatus Tectomicrobia bacterium]
MVLKASASEAASTVTEAVLLLENGDQLTRDEFERRYTAMPQIKKAELIEGIVYMPSPVRIAQHAEPHAHLLIWLGLYVMGTPGVRVADNATVRLELDNELQPDVLLYIDQAYGGQSRIDADGYMAGAPELVAEVAASSASYDLHAKMQVYRRSGVREYLVWRALDQAIDWFVLRTGHYICLPVGADAIIRSEMFPGLWLAPAALLDGALATVHTVAQQGLASPEHAAFVARVQANRRP